MSGVCVHQDCSAAVSLTTAAPSVLSHGIAGAGTKRFMSSGQCPLLLSELVLTVSVVPNGVPIAFDAMTEA